MKTRTALIIAIVLGLFTYTLPLYAGEKEHHIEEKTVIDIPVVGKITTRTTSYLSGCKLKESTSTKLHNALVQLVSDSDGKSTDIQLSDLCDEIQWEYNEALSNYESRSFHEIRTQYQQDNDDSDIHIDIESDQMI